MKRILILFALLLPFIAFCQSEKNTAAGDTVINSITAKLNNYTENRSTEVETASQAEVSLLKILRQWGGITEIVPLGERWEGGTLLLQPKDKTQKPKELPIEVFFHKIVMLRDRLRVLEQQLNAHKLLSDGDKVNLQQYITRIYGSLTTFNVLFKNKEQWFTGEKGGKED